MLDTTEDKAALTLLVLGFIAIGGVAVSAAGAAGALLLLGIYGVFAAINIAVGVVAAFATASLMKTSFGLFWPAVLRLAAIIVFSVAVSVLLPMGWILSFFVYIGLLMWFFELEPLEIVVFTIILRVMEYVVGQVLAAMLVAALT